MVRVRSCRKIGQPKSPITGGGQAEVLGERSANGASAVTAVASTKGWGEATSGLTRKDCKPRTAPSDTGTVVSWGVGSCSGWPVSRLA